MRKHSFHRWSVPALVAAVAALLLLAACTGPEGRAGPPGAKGAKGDPGAEGPQGPAGPEGARGGAGQPGNPGTPGTTGPQGPQGSTGPAGVDSVSPEAGIMVGKPAFYLDEGLAMAGSGFQPFEAVIVYFDLGGGDEPTVGFAAANRGGAWTLDIPALSAVRSVSGSATDLAEAGVATLKADGADGSTVSIPVNILGVSTPVGPRPAPAPGAAPSLIAGTVEAGGDIEVLGGGYAVNEPVTISAITGPGAQDRSQLARASANERGVVTATITVDLEPGAYTLEGSGAFGSLASTVLIVVEEGK